jgi:hypothetical protein
MKMNDLPKEHRSLVLSEVLDPTRELTRVANTTPGEQAANQTVLEAIKLVRHHPNAELEIAALLQIAQEAYRQAFADRKTDPNGTHRLRGADTSIEEVLMKLPIYRWPNPSKRNGRTKDELHQLECRGWRSYGEVSSSEYGSATDQCRVPTHNHAFPAAERGPSYGQTFQVLRCICNNSEGPSVPAMDKFCQTCRVRRKCQRGRVPTRSEATLVRRSERGVSLASICTSPGWCFPNTALSNIDELTRKCLVWPSWPFNRLDINPIEQLGGSSTENSPLPGSRTTKLLFRQWLMPGTALI